MPRSFLVKKTRFTPHTSSQDVIYKHHGTSIWPIEQKLNQDVTLLHQHLIKLSNKRLELDIEDDNEPLDYSVKKPQTDSEASFEHSSENSTPEREPLHSFDKFVITDGRSKKRKHLFEQPSSSPPPKFVCGECGKHYATSSNLSRHKQTHRSMDSSQAKKCPQCEKVYVSMPALSMHILTHKLKHVCPQCDKAFSRPWLLQGHLRSHTGERPYGCVHCGKKFADRSNLRAHMQTHEEAKHTCNKCEKSFTLKSYLNKHIETSCITNSQDC